MTGKITYKKPPYVLVWLRAALEKEWQKYFATPVRPDLMPGHEAAQAWGYVVAGYFLLEQGFKAILHVRGKKPPKIHALSVLFAELSQEDQDTLRAHYDDFRQTFPGIRSFPLGTLDDFLVNLDGERSSRGHYTGSFDWRYFPTEEGKGKSMPVVSIHVMHEIVYGCVRLVGSIHRGSDEPSRCSYSWRLRRYRWKDYRDWLMIRMNSPEWGQGGDRLEILWGPDYRDRYDYLVFEGDRIRSFFAPLPNAEATELAVVDRRSELDSFDPAEGFRSIGWVASHRSAKRRDPESRHVMY
ncbi:MAG: hypothetical protein F4087_06345 [Gemmatimonadetes bacterium]|nr:hypothetical protein [Gemmatimonadota bacterium]MYE95329.1 hypothetical protein [Gemmatimonadota bacterium]MYJ68115.1 hypothetical protein [Gemmatimonadota bacterium]